ncbi:MAG: flavodoxin family protein [Candidatus Bathyarchaeota archaeon]|nr:flavodoxin family protein [Candidatus Bathyarchaeota archaeon]
MKVLGVVCGPRKTGNTARLVEEVLAGASEAGHETKIFYLSEMEITPLKAGDDGYIYPDDGFAEIMPHIESMGALVQGTPIYYDHVSSRTKLFIDRLYYYSRSHGDEYRAKFPDGVKCVNIITCGWDKPDVYNEVLEWWNRRMTNYWKMSIHGTLKAYGTGNKPVAKNLELLGDARSMGRSL